MRLCLHSHQAQPQTAGTVQRSRARRRRAGDSEATAEAAAPPSTAISFASCAATPLVLPYGVAQKLLGRRAPGIAILRLLARDLASKTGGKQRLPEGPAEARGAAGGDELQPRLAAEASDPIGPERRQRVASQQVL